MRSVQFRSHTPWCSLNFREHIHDFTIKMVGVDGRRRVLLVEDDVFQLNIVAEMCVRNVAMRCRPWALAKVVSH